MCMSGMNHRMAAGVLSRAGRDFTIPAFKVMIHEPAVPQIAGVAAFGPGEHLQRRKCRFVGNSAGFVVAHLPRLSAIPAF